MNPEPLQLTLHITIVQSNVYAKSFYISRVVRHFYETEFEIWAGLCQLGSLYFMYFLLFITNWTDLYFRLVK